MRQLIKYYNVLLLLFAVASMPCMLLAQDIHFSQYMSSPLNLNPANTGNFNGDIRIVGNHRNQWSAVTEPYRTYSLSGDVRFGFKERSSQSGGMLFNYDRAGDSKLTTMQILLSYSYTRVISADGRHAISGGIQAGVTLRSISYSDLLFDEQFDGDAYNPLIVNSENFDNTSHTYPDFGAGIQYTFTVNEKLKLGGGAGWQHLNKPDDSFFGQKVKVDPRTQVNVFADAGITDKIGIIPTLLWMSQSTYRELTAGASVRFRLNNKPGKQYAFYAGMQFRKQDALIPTVGIDYNNLYVGASYDVNTSDLERASNGRGGFELSAIYIITKVKPQAPKPPCPVY